MVVLIDLINSIYPAQRDVNIGYKNNLLSECKYFNESNDMIDNIKDKLGIEDEL
jgi:hypothetical protein